MSKAPTELQHPCVTCDRETWHDIMFRHVDSVEEYRVDTAYFVVQCKGCKTIAFRKTITDYENSFPISEDEWEFDRQIFAYPKVLLGYRELQDVWDIPEPVRSVYKQSVQAIRDDADILAGIGLRATIEAVCNERSIVGRTLDKRIDGLTKAGLISEKDAERLHAIRFLGNDSAHEVRHADPRSLLIALRIIEHLLTNLYILDGETDGRLDTIIKTPEKFLDILNLKLSNFSAGDEVPLAKIFGKDIRRLHETLTKHESFLISEINAGSYAKLQVGKIDNYAGSKDKLQHFLVT